MSQKSSKRGAKGRPRHLWTEVGSDNIHMLLSEKFPAFQWGRKGEHVTGRCPFHDDASPSFIVTPSKGIAKCFGCNIVFTDFMAFARRVMGGSAGQVAATLRKRFNLKTLLSEAQLEKLNADDIVQTHLLKFFKFCGSVLIQAAGAYASEFAHEPHLFFAKDALESLRNRRLGYPSPGEVGSDEEHDPNSIDPHGLLSSLVQNQLIAIIPPMAMIQNFYADDPDGLTFVRKYWGQYIESGGTYQGFFILPYHTAPNVFGCFKIRSPQREQKNMLYVGVDADEKKFRGYYGFHNASVWLGPTSITGTQMVQSVVFTEGEFDALQCIAHQLRISQDDYIVLAVGGSSLQPPDALADLGVTKVFLNQDRDHGGDEMVEKFLRGTKAAELNFYILQWPTLYSEWRSPANPELRIKDPDDAIVHLGYPKWRQFVCSEDTYKRALDWVFDKANKDLATMPPGDVRQKSRAAMDWGQCLLDNTECRNYAHSIAAHHDLEANHIIQGILSKDEGEKEFVDRLLTTIQDKLHFVGTRCPENGKRYVVFFSKKRKQIDSMAIGDLRAIEATFSSYFGTLYDFVLNEMGEPGFMAPKDDAGNPSELYPLTMKAKKYTEYVNFAIQKAVPALPSLDLTPMKAQGYHFMGDKNGELTSYLVNGHDVYHIAHAGGGMKVQLLEGPSHHDVLFNCRENAWLKTLTKADDLLSSTANPVEIFVQMRDMLQLAWGWQNTDAMRDATFLAAFCMCIPIMNAFSRQVAIILNAEKQSGKSRFLGGFLGGHEFPSIHMVAHTVVMNGYTEPAIRQQRDGSTLCLCLEEFEDEGGNERRSVVVRRSLELFRDLISESEVKWSVGSASGQSKEYRLRFPLACTAIHPLRDGASLSRFVPFALKHSTSKADPQHVILKKWGAETVAKIRHDLGVGMYRYVPQVREHQAVVTNEYSSGDLLPAYVPARFREAMMPILTMLRFLSELPGGKEVIPNYRTFAQDFAEDRKDFLTQLHTTSVNEQVFQSILESPFRVTGTESLTTTIRSMLGDLNSLANINKTHQGVFIDVKNEWLVIPWIQTCQGVLSNTPYKNEKAVYLKKIAERSPHFVAVEDAKRERVLERLVGEMGPGVSHDLVTIFSVKHLVNETRAMWATRQAGGTPGAAPPASGNNGMAPPVTPTEPAVNSSPNHIDDMGV